MAGNNPFDYTNKEKAELIATQLNEK